MSPSNRPQAPNCTANGATLPQLAPHSDRSERHGDIKQFWNHQNPVVRIGCIAGKLAEIFDPGMQSAYVHYEWFGSGLPQEELFCEIPETGPGGDESQMERVAAKKHVLVLEDDSSISELLDWILSDAGYDVTCVGSLKSARSVCSESMPDVIVADLLLPDGLGSDLVYEVTTKYNGSSPVSIVMSAVPQAGKHARAAGASLCLTKPFDLNELLDSISDLTERNSDGVR